MKQTSARLITHRLFRGLWLFFTMLQAMWAFILYGAWSVNSGALQKLVDTMVTSQDVSQRATYELPGFVAQPLTAIVVVAVLLCTVFILARAPKTAADMTIRATSRAAKTIDPVVRRALPKKVATKHPWYITTLTRVITSALLFIATMPVCSMIEGVDQVVLWTLSGALGAVALVLGAVPFTGDLSKKT